MGYGRPTTPFLDQLAADSFVFPNAIAAGVPTYYSFPAIMASRHPLAWGRELAGLAVGETNLASSFKAAGYRTAFFGAANPYLSAQFGYDFGFGTFSDFLQSDLDSDLGAPTKTDEKSWPRKLNRALESVSRGVPGLGAAYDELYFQYSQRRAAAQSNSLEALRRFPAAGLIVDQAQAWLRAVGDHPFFLWLHFMDPHAPYYPTEEALKLLGEDDFSASRARYCNSYWNRSDLGTRRLLGHRKRILALYDAAIRWVDEQLSRFVTTLRNLNIWENCVLALTADHGEEFLDHDARYHSPALHEELIHVPLLLRVPDAVKNEVCCSPFSLLHLAPTLLGAAEVPIPMDFQGLNLWPQIQSGLDWSLTAMAECVAGCTNPLRVGMRNGNRMLAIRERRYKLVLNFGASSEGTWDRLFDLEADPNECHPLPPSRNRPERARLLRIALDHIKNPKNKFEADAYFRTRMRMIKQSLISKDESFSMNLADASVPIPVP
jgi:arylsulfatase A-like enzyme